MSGQRKSILFLTGTRADFGKLKPLMDVVQNDSACECRVSITGMHMLNEYGYTAKEVLAKQYEHYYTFVNQILSEPMDLVLANTVHGLGRYVHNSPPDAIIIHGDRIEALAGAIVGCLRNITTIHIEGGELSGTIDELIRHSVSKLAHIHLVANQDAANRLIQLGESASAIYAIGSPDIDVMFSPDLPSIEQVRERYEIPFDRYAIACYHPVTTELDRTEENVKQFFKALLTSGDRYVLIYPNNDEGAEVILSCIREVGDSPNLRVIPSLRFEYFLTLLRESQFIIGNSSAAIREAPVYGVPTVNVGTRQHKRFDYQSILNVDPECDAIIDAIKQAKEAGRYPPTDHFGSGDSSKKFAALLQSNKFWEQSKQKVFEDLPSTRARSQ
ncbi:MAG: UDP-N-acetylglucosamine 2-epimerase [Aureliella sp.]